MKAHPVALACLALVAVVVAAVTTLAGLGRTVPTFLPEIAFALVTGGLGVTVPGLSSSTSSTSSSTSSAPPPPPGAP